MSSVWDTQAFASENKYVTFSKVGDKVEGTVTAVGVQTWDNGDVSPRITLATAAGEQTVTAGQIRLKIALAEKRPEIGDSLSITLTQIESRSMGKTLKHFDVQVFKPVTEEMVDAPF